MPTFNSLKELFSHLEKQAQSTLKNEIAETVVETMQEHIQHDVYDKYTPTMYQRKGYSGGLIDEHNIEVAVVDNNTISVENIRFEDDREIAQIVESGQGYMYNFPFNGVARPFTENTRIELRRTGKLQQVMKQGLKKRGIDTV